MGWNSPEGDPLPEEAGPTRDDEGTAGEVVKRLTGVEVADFDTYHPAPQSQCGTSTV